MNYDQFAAELKKLASQDISGEEMFNETFGLMQHVNIPCSIDSCLVATLKPEDSY